MAINPIKFIVSPSVTATNGSDTITVTGNVDCSKVYSGTVVSISGKQIVEAISGTPADGSGNSTITLRSNWTQVTTTADMVAFNSIEGLSEAIRRARELVENINALDLLAGQGVIHKEPNGEYVLKEITTSASDTTAGRLLKVGDFNLGVGAPTKADFFALAEKRIRDNAGSGFSEWGKHDLSVATFIPVNQGIWQQASVANILNMGSTSAPAGTSRTNHAIASVNGVVQQLKNTNFTDASARNVIKFPPAPNGTKTYDSSNGAVVTHASTAAAFAAETATNKVIISRQDFVLLESWHEKITDKDVVYPLGNVQFGATSWDSVALSNALVAQGYSAFGEWDTATKGYGAVWSTLSDADKVKFLQDPENNIYNDDGGLVQVRYRIRVIEGLGDNWENVNDFMVALKYNSTSAGVKPRGSLSVPVADLATYNANNSGYFEDRTALPELPAGLWRAINKTANDVDTTIAHNGLCFAIPIALVQRRNTGIYTPTHNPNGTWLAGRNDGSTNGENWYSSIAYAMTNTADCFNAALRAKTTEGGMIGGVSGRSDSKFYDAIYASDVQDLRMSAKRLPLAEIRETYKRKAIAGEVRGFEAVPKYSVTINQIGGAGSGTTFVSYSQFVGHNALASNGGFIIINGNAYGVYAHGNDFWVKLAKYINGVATAGDYTAEISTGTYPYIPSNGNNLKTLEAAVMIQKGSKSRHKQAKPTWTDIIGDPANIAATFPNGVEGQWIPVIPDGTGKTFNANRKVVSMTTPAKSEVVYSSNNGTSWANTAYISSYSGTYSETTNTLVAGAISASQVMLYHYETQAHFTQNAANSKVLDLGGVFATLDHRAIYGSALANSCTSKVLTGALVSANGSAFLDKYLTKFQTLNNGNLYAQNAVTIEHDALTPVSISTPTNAVKTLDYLSSTNNVATLNYAYKEMVWDFGSDNSSEFTQVASTDTVMNTTVGELFAIANTSDNSKYRVRALVATSTRMRFLSPSGNYWIDDAGVKVFVNWEGNGFGDNNKFEIIDNQGSQLDDNGNTVIYGTARFNTQYFVVEK